MARRLTTMLDPGVTDTHCESDEGCCDFVFHTMRDLGWRCDLHNEAKLETDEDGRCMRHPDCIANEKATEEVRGLALDALNERDGYGMCRGGSAWRRRLGL